MKTKVVSASQLSSKTLLASDYVKPNNPTDKARAIMKECDDDTLHSLLVFIEAKERQAREAEKMASSKTKDKLNAFAAKAWMPVSINKTIKVQMVVPVELVFDDLAQDARPCLINNDKFERIMDKACKKHVVAETKRVKAIYKSIVDKAEELGLTQDDADDAIMKVW